MIIQSQLSPTVCCVLCTPNKALFVVTTLLIRVTPSDGNVYLENYASQGICCIIFSTCFFNKESQHEELVCKFRFILYTYEA
jgi:hypothetical protein